jgi:hypothetical protein
MSKKKALIVAINGYPSPNELPSCIADGDAFSRYLEMEGFTEIRKLYDAEATIANVEQGVDWLTDDVMIGDTAIVFYSGHGYSKEIDGCMEESLVLLSEQGQPVLWQDDRLVARSEGLPPGALIVVCDSCYSGGMQKLVLDPTGAEVARIKTFQPSREQLGNSFALISSARGPAAKRVTATRRFGRATRGFGVPKGMLGATKAVFDSSEAEQPEFNGVMLSACLEIETAAASTPQTGGLSAFTCKLLESLARLPPGTSTRDVLVTTETALKTAGFRQTCSAWAREGSGLLERSFLHAETAPTNHTQHESQELDMPSTNVNDYIDRAAADKKLLEDIGRTVIQLAPTVIDLFRRKDLTLPSAPNGGSVDQKALDFLVPFLPIIAETVVGIVAPKKRKDLTLLGEPSNGEGQDKVLQVVIPIAVSVAGALFNAFKKKDFSFAEVHVPEGADKALIDQLLGTLVRLLPEVVNSVSTTARAA